MLNANKAYATHNNTYIMQNLINLFAEGCHSHHHSRNEMENSPRIRQTNRLTATHISKLRCSLIQIQFYFIKTLFFFVTCIKVHREAQGFCFANTNMEQGNKMCDAICIIFMVVPYKKRILFMKRVSLFSIEIMLMLCGAGRKICEISLNSLLEI